MHASSATTMMERTDAITLGKRDARANELIEQSIEFMLEYRTSLMSLHNFFSTKQLRGHRLTEDTLTSSLRLSTSPLTCLRKNHTSLFLFMLGQQLKVQDKACKTRPRAPAARMARQRSHPTPVSMASELAASQPRPRAARSNRDEVQETERERERERWSAPGAPLRSICTTSQMTSLRWCPWRSRREPLKWTLSVERPGPQGQGRH